MEHKNEPTDEELKKRQEERRKQRRKYGDGTERSELMGAGGRPRYGAKDTRIKSLIEPINSFVLLPDKAMRLLVKLARMHHIGVREMVVVALMDRARYDSAALPVEEMRKCLAEVKMVEDELQEVWADPPLLPRWFRVSLYSVAEEYGTDTAWSLGGGRVGRWRIASDQKKSKDFRADCHNMRWQKRNLKRNLEKKGLTPTEVAQQMYLRYGLLPEDYNYTDKVRLDLDAPGTKEFQKFLTPTKETEMREDAVYRRDYPLWARRAMRKRRHKILVNQGIIKEEEKKEKPKPKPDQVWPDEI